MDSMLPFTGETMCCAMCKRVEKSDAGRSSQWRLIEVERRRHYICPRHFPPDGSSKKAFEEAYLRVFRRLQIAPPG